MNQPFNHTLYRDVLSLSSGTIATLTGESSYEMIDMIHADLLQVARHVCRGEVRRLVPRNPTWMDIAKLHPSVRRHMGLCYPIQEVA